MAVMRLSLEMIRLDFQPHENLIPETVVRYRDCMKRRDRIEPVVVCYDGANYWLKDGFHRFEAARDLGRQTIMAEVIPGTLADMEAEWQRYLKALKAEQRQKLGTEGRAGKGA
jgi:ParB-like chromosome segregation protein Spo0J